MKKNIITIITLIFLLFVSVGGYILYKKYSKDKKITQITQNNYQKLKDKGESKVNKQDPEKIKKEIERIEKFKKQLQSKGLIVKGDIELKNKQYLFALQKFLKANKQTPNNPKILSKIGEIYFYMKKFDLAYKYLKNIEEKKYESKKILSFLYSQKIEENNFNWNSSGSLDNSGSIIINNIQKQIENFEIDPEEKFYYKNSLECIKNFHICKKKFEAYFKNTNYSGKNKNLENIKQAIINYKNAQINELYYKNTLIIGSLFQNKNFPITIILSKNLLKQKPNYKPILKILAQSYYELGKIEETKNYLRKFTQLDTTNPDISYMLGAIDQKTHNYIQSNIFLDLAVKQGYKDKESILRLKLYNFLMLQEKQKILESFDKIIASQKKPESNDLILASYYNILNNNLDKALLYTNIGIKSYPKKEDFYGLKAWILIEKQNYTKAKELLKKAEEINSRNAVIALNLGRIEFLNYKETQKIINKIRAKLYFKKAQELDNTEIGKLAGKFLEKLELEKKQ